MTQSRNWMIVAALLGLAPIGLIALASENRVETTTTIVGRQSYKIPRDFYAGSPSGREHVSLRMFAPDMMGRTPKDIPCLDYRNSCNDREVLVGLMAGEIPTGQRQLENIRYLILPEAKTGHCGFSYYESNSHPSHRLIYFVTKLHDDAEISILRCSQEDGKLRGHCSSTENVGDGNRFYFVMHVKRLCEWPEVQGKILDRIKSFRKDAE